jgi:secreted trypsin-like serine protease
VTAVSPLKKPAAAGGLFLAVAAGCSSTDASSVANDPRVATSSSAIQGGMDDTTHDFVVGVVQRIPRSRSIAMCTGVLLAPNLVATARHCVSQLTDTQIDCATSMFTATLPASDMWVTFGPTVHANPPYTVAQIMVPQGNAVCGTDIALLILTDNISLPEYVTPTVKPPMTDHNTYTTKVTAIGYGVDSPTDVNGSTAGVRRIRENIGLACIPNDPIPADCYSDPMLRQVISANEFAGGDGTCEGDSGSGAFDQGSFNSGKWVAFGVLSRGGVSPEGGLCLGSIYTRFDAWGQLLVDAASQASMMGGYNPASWTGLPPNPNIDGGSSDGGSCRPSGTFCSDDTQCCSMSCIAYDNQPFTCQCDDSNRCGSGFSCQRGVCVPMADGGQGSSARSSCSVGPGRGAPALPWRIFAAALAVASLARARGRLFCRKSDSPVRKLDRQGEGGQDPGDRARDS